jgi:hypothetical protein
MKPERKTTMEITKGIDIKLEKVEKEERKKKSKKRFLLGLGIAIVIMLICLTITLCLVDSKPNQHTEEVLESKTLKWKFPKSKFYLCCSTIEKKQDYLETCNKVFEKENIECTDVTEGSIILHLKSTRIDFEKVVDNILSEVKFIGDHSTEDHHKYTDESVFDSWFKYRFICIFVMIFC